LWNTSRSLFIRKCAVLSEPKPWGEQKPQDYVMLLRCDRMLKSVHALTTMNIKCISLGGDGKGSQCIGLTTLPPSCASCLQILGELEPVQACNDIALIILNVTM